jgi:hypothetical protein
MTMSQPQAERALITCGVVVCVIGGLAVAAGAWSASNARQFRATAVRATGTIIASGHPRGAVRFMAERDTVVEGSLPAGHNQPPGTKVKILYEPGNPNHWIVDEGDDSTPGLGMSVAGAAMLIGGLVMSNSGRIRRWLDRSKSAP